MDDELVTIDSIKDAFKAETFSDPAEQCKLYVRTFRSSFDQAEYNGLNPTCASMPAGS